MPVLELVGAVALLLVLLLLALAGLVRTNDYGPASARLAPTRGPSRDRRLPGKSRRQARRARRA